MHRPPCRVAVVAGAGRRSPPLVVLHRAAGPGAARDADYEMPFTCGQEWTGSTRVQPLAELHSHRLEPHRRPRRARGGLGGGHGHAGHEPRQPQLRALRHRRPRQRRDARSTPTSRRSTSPSGSGIDQGQLIGLRRRLRRQSPGPTCTTNSGRRPRRSRPGSATPPSSCGTHAAPPRNCADTPVAGDWNGDGGRRGRGLPAQAHGQLRLRRGRHRATVPLGAGTDDPLVGDWDGDGADDLGVRDRGRPAPSRCRAADGTTQVQLRHARPTAASPATGTATGRPRSASGGRRRRRSCCARPTAAVHAGGPRLASARCRSPVTGTATAGTDLGVFDDGTWTLWLRRADGTTWSGTVASAAPATCR